MKSLLEKKFCQKPNIIYILTDDIDYGELGVQGGGAVRGAPTPQLDRMAQILAEEIARTAASWETARRDSRLGYEWEMDYMYRPDVLREKLELLRLTLDKQLPAYRAARRR